MEFRSAAFPAFPEELKYGKSLAKFLESELPTRDLRQPGYALRLGLALGLAERCFPALDGLQNHEEYEEGFLWSIEPSKPFVRRWLTAISTFDTLERLATAVE